MFSLIFSFSLLFSIVLALGAVSGYLSERAGIINIGLNGFITIGALIYVVVSRSVSETSGWMQIPIALIAMIGTGIFSFLHSIVCVRYKANQTISGTAINLLASGITLFVINVVYKSPTVGIGVKTDALAVSNDINSPWTFLTVLTFIALALIALVYVIMRYTRFGLRMRASGENPSALAAQGINVLRIRYQAVFISGLIAGLAGSIFVQRAGSFFGAVNGVGWIALAIIIAGQWRIPLMLIASIVFGFLTSLSKVPGVPDVIKDNYDVFKALPFLISIGVLLFTARYAYGPRSAGIPYDPNAR